MKKPKAIGVIIKMSTSTGKAYARQRPEVHNPREVEAWALIESGKALIEAKENLSDINLLRNALRANMILWTVFQDAVTDPSSPLPFEIRNNLLNLSLFVDKHTLQCLADEDGVGVDILIEINHNIAAGLMENNSDAARPSNDGRQEDKSTDSPNKPSPGLIGNIEA